MNTMKNVFWGIVLIVLGLILGLNALDITNINIFFDGWWTLFIIVPCFIGLFNDKDKTGNIIGLLIGIALLLCSLGILDFDIIWKLSFPTILVIIGLSFVFKDSLNNKINKEINKIMALVEKYPELKANTNFLNLSQNLSDVEDELAKSRRYYNAIVRMYNNKVEMIPSNLVAKIFGYKIKDMFSVEDEERENVEVKL